MKLYLSELILAVMGDETEKADSRSQLKLGMITF